MIAARKRATRLALTLRFAGALLAAVGMAVLGVSGSPGPASAATSDYNQMTGSGNTSSAVTVSWRQGLLDSSNKPLTDGESTGELSPNSDRSSASPTSPLSFMYGDFKNLKFTISQTQDIVHQGITVTWSGGVPTTATSDDVANFMQVMECYGDAATGPSPEDCEFGSPNLLPGNALNPNIGGRTGVPCLFGSPSTVNPPPGWNGQPPFDGCDPNEPGHETPSHLPPCSGVAGCATEPFYVPFVPVSSPNQPVYDATTLSQYFTQYTTNEVQQGVTGTNGTGEDQFQALTGVQSQGLGCGTLEANGRPRGCWLVIVPRGESEPNGFHVNLAKADAQDQIQSTPLSAGNWAQRIQVHLSYAPDALFCANPPNETLTTGTQLIGRAMQSWELALNQQANCKVVYGFAANYESSVTSEMSGPGTPFGLGFTTIPIGSEGTETGGPPTSVPQTLYAPVAVTALDFAYNINDGTGYVTTPVKLSPTLLAKALTQVYRSDLPDYYPDQAMEGPTWSQRNPLNMGYDPEFQKLNPEISPLQGTQTQAPITTLDLSAQNQRVWQWIQASSAADSWLDGTPDQADNVVQDPDYTALHLGQGTPQNLFPKAYKGELKLTVGDTTEVKQTTDILPGQPFLDSVATEVLSATNPSVGAIWDPTIVNPASGTLGYWAKSLPETAGGTFISGFVDTAAVGDYGLIPASLCSSDGANGKGSNCVALTSASVSAALASAKPDSSGLLQVNPAKVPAGAFPLVDVVYAAVLTNQSADQLSKYADLISYAAGKGQTPGSAPGDLPPGYLPLPASLQQQAQGVVTKLRRLASGQPTSTPSSSGGGGSSSGGTPTGTGTGTATGGGSGTGGAGPGTTPAQAPSPSAGGGATTPAPAAGPSSTPGVTIAPPTVHLANASDTPAQPVGPVRLVLIIVVIVGVASAGAGILLRSARLPRWRRRPKGAGP